MPQMTPPTLQPGSPAPQVPVLETERLILRGHRREDFADLAALWADLAVVQHIVRRPASDQESWMRLLRYAGLWPLLGFGYWAITIKSTGAYAGDMGFADFHRPIDVPIRGLPEAGWVLTSRYQGQGLAREALAACLGWAQGREGFQRITAIIDPRNTRSVRLAEGAGFGHFAETVMDGDPVGVWHRLA